MKSKKYVIPQKTLSLLAMILTMALLTACADDKTQAVVVGATPEHYERLGLNMDMVEVHEDGTNTGGADGTFEWWYFDAALDDGSNLVLTFYTRSMMNPNGPLAPFVTFEWTGADGTLRSERVIVDPADFFASDQGCDVRIGENYIKGDLQEYELYFKQDDLEARVHLSSNAQSWRPGTGYRLYGDDEENYAAWLCAVPEGDVSLELSMDGHSATYQGSGYHDHNWGNLPLWRMQNNWYWGRAKTEDYVVISFDIVTTADYGFEEFTTFVLFKDGAVIAESFSDVQFAADDIFIDAETGIPIANKLLYTLEDGDRQYVVEYQRENTILASSMMAALPDADREEAVAAGNKLMYYRFNGSVSISVIENGTVVDSQTTQEAVWELMFPGVVR